MLPPLPRRSDCVRIWLNPTVISIFPDSVVGSICASTFSRFARRSLALRPAHSRRHQFVTLFTRRLQPYRYLHDRSGCYWLEPWPGGTLTHRKAPPLHGAHAQAVNTLCRQLYSHTFFARYHYQKPEKVVRLTLQTAQTVRQFFDGGWLEWFAFIEVVEQLKARDISFSCARGVKVRFENEDLHELDVVLLPQGQAPICIECKSGEFRRDIDKYLRLRKRLGIERSRFIICAADLTEDQASGLSAMYELTFVNLTSLPARIQNLI